VNFAQNQSSPNEQQAKLPRPSRTTMRTLALGILPDSTIDRPAAPQWVESTRTEARVSITTTAAACGQRRTKGFVGPSTLTGLTRDWR